MLNTAVTNVQGDWPSESWRNTQLCNISQLMLLILILFLFEEMRANELFSFPLSLKVFIISMTSDVNVFATADLEEKMNNFTEVMETCPLIIIRYLSNSVCNLKSKSLSPPHTHHIGKRKHCDCVNYQFDEYFLLSRRLT